MNDYDVAMSVTQKKLNAINTGLANRYTAIDRETMSEGKRERLKKQAFREAQEEWREVRNIKEKALQDRVKELQREAFGMSEGDSRFFEACDNMRKLGGEDLRTEYDRARKLGDKATERAAVARALEIGEKRITADYAERNPEHAEAQREYFVLANAVHEKARLARESLALGTVHEPYVVERERVKLGQAEYAPPESPYQKRLVDVHGEVSIYSATPPEQHESPDTEGSQRLAKFANEHAGKDLRLQT